MSGAVLAASVEAIVGLGQALVAIDHELRAEVVIGVAGGFQRGVVLEAFREGKGAETVGGCVTQIVLHAKTKKTAPRFHGCETGGLQKVRILRKRNNIVRRTYYRSSRQETER